MFIYNIHRRYGNASLAMLSLYAQVPGVHLHLNLVCVVRLFRHSTVTGILYHFDKCRVLGVLGVLSDKKCMCNYYLNYFDFRF